MGNRKYKANFFTRYTFAAGWAKGLYIGGGYRYLGRMLVGQPNPGVLQYAPPVGEATFMAGREFKVLGDRRLRVQLNVNNLFDETEPIIARYQSTGNTTMPRAINTRAPGTWRLTTAFDF